MNDDNWGAVITLGLAALLIACLTAMVLYGLGIVPCSFPSLKEII